MTSASSRPRRIFMLGATGTIGGSAVRALVAQGHDVVCFVRRRTGASRTCPAAAPVDGATIRYGDATDPDALARDGFCGESFDVLISCLASRTGAPDDAWKVDYGANMNALEAARVAGVSHVILLSAICVQKPRLAFQHAKLAFEDALIQSGLKYSIVRPTAFFKSLSGQIDRVKRGKSFLVFGDGTLTACKPISDDDLAAYLAACLDDPAMQDRILPIGGPGAAISPNQQAERLFALLNVAPRVTRVPVAFLDAIILVLGTLGKILPAAAAKAELARIGRYYATESMLVLDTATGRYDADATPSAGTETLFDFYERVIAGTITVERGDHAVF